MARYRRHLLGRDLHRPDNKGNFKARGWRKIAVRLCGCFLGTRLLCICSGTSSQTATWYWSSHASLKESSMPCRYPAAWSKEEKITPCLPSLGLQHAPKIRIGLASRRKAQAATETQLQGPCWAHQPPWLSLDHNLPALSP